MSFNFPTAPALDQTYDPGTGTIYQWNGTAWVPKNSSSGFLILPAGMGIDWWGAAAPSGTRWCDGAQYDPTVYVALFAAIGTTYNTGGETSGGFRVPDARGRVGIGKDNMGGTAADRVTTAGGHGIDGKVLGARGGLDTHTLSSAQIAAHQHTYTSPGSVIINATTGANYTVHTTGGVLTGSVGGGGSHPNVQPGIVCNRLIVTGGVP